MTHADRQADSIATPSARLADERPPKREAAGVAKRGGERHDDAAAIGKPAAGRLAATGTAAPETTGRGARPDAGAAPKRTAAPDRRADAAVAAGSGAGATPRSRPSARPQPATRAGTPAARALPTRAASSTGGPTHEPRLARVAALVADPTRARMLAFLLSGEYASASELARTASVSAATASAHLARLVDAGLLVCEPRGRHRYFRIADADVAHALEALAMVAERASHERAWAAPARLRLREARCCYGHLAGRSGVAMLARMIARGWLVAAEDGYVLGPGGADGLRTFGFDAERWVGARPGPRGRRVAYPCLDWSERRDHLAGQLASALLDHFIARGWLRRIGGERALELTPPGQRALGALIAPEAAGAA